MYARNAYSEPGDDEGGAEGVGSTRHDLSLRYQQGERRRAGA